MDYCIQCGTEVSGGSFCAQCGAPVEPLSRMHGDRQPSGVTGDFDERLMAALAYASPLPAVAFLALEPYRSNRFVRFHSFQCLLLTVAATLLIWLTSVIAIFAFVEALLTSTFQIAIVAMWLLAAYKAWNGHEYSLPVIGAIARQCSRG